ncbi:MAG: autotransporter domain-containing protein, partial [Opitutaceae bacterium]
SIINANLGTGIVTANGTVALNGTSSAATVNIETGTTTLGSAERLLDTSDVTVSSGAKLVLGGSEKIGTLDGAGEVSVQLGTLTVDDGTFSGVISGTDGAFGLTKVSSGLLTLSGANTYVGTTQINAGTVDLTGSLVSPTVNVTSGTTLNDKSGGLADDTVATVDGTLALTASDAIDTLNGGGSVTLDDSIFTVNQGAFSGVVSGTGGLTVATGTLTLTGANTYSGGTIIDNGGTLALSTGGSLLSTGAVTANGAFDISQSADQTIGDLSGSGTVQLGDHQLTLGTAGDSTYSGLIENGGLGGGTTGGLVKQGSGNFTLTGTSTVPTVNVNEGKLTLAGATPNLATTTAVTVESGATLAVNSDNTVASFTSNGGTVSGTNTLTAPTYDLNDGTQINGKLGNASGGSTVNSNGTVTFTATVAATTINVQTGLLTVDGLDLLSHDATLNLATAATLQLLHGDQTINTLNGDGLLVLNGNNLNVTDGGTYSGTTTNTGDFNVGTPDAPGGNTLTLSGDNTNTNTNVNSGTLVIDTTGTLNTGATVVNSGATVVDNGTVNSDVVVNTGGTFMGAGTVTGDYTGNGNTSPGNSPGVLTVVGDYTENGTLNIEIAGNVLPVAGVDFDQVDVGGTTTLNPTTSTLDIASFGGFPNPVKGDTFLIINSPGGISGHFGTFTNNFTNDMIFVVSTGQLVGTGLVTGGTGLNLANAFTGANANLLSMINGLQVGDHQYVGGDLLPLLLQAPTSAAATIIANKASPEAYAGFTDYADRVTRSYTDKAVNLTPLVQTGKYSIFAGYASLDTGSSSSNNQADYDLQSNGVVAGARAAINPRLTVGLFAGFDDGSVDSTYLNSNVKGNVYGIFGEYVAKADRSLTLTASLSTATYSTDGTRQTATSTSSFNGVDSSANLAALGLRYRIFERRTVVIEPELRLTYVSAKTDGFTETNTNALQALNVHSQSNTSFITEAAVNTRYLATSKLSLNARLGVSYNADDTARDVSANVVSETQSFTVQAPGMGDTAFNLGVGANYSITPAWTVGASYQGAVAADAKTSNSFYVNTAIGF